jgi:hypothetical protein
MMAVSGSRFGTEPIWYSPRAQIIFPYFQTLYDELAALTKIDGGDRRRASTTTLAPHSLGERVGKAPRSYGATQERRR